MNNFRWQGKDFGAWLMTIARNLTTDHFKAGRTRLEQTTEDMSRPRRHHRGPGDRGARVVDQRDPDGRAEEAPGRAAGLPKRALTACPSCGGAVLDLPPILTSASDPGRPRPARSCRPTGGRTDSLPRRSALLRAIGGAALGRADLDSDSDRVRRPGLPTSTGNGPLDDLTDGVLPTVTTSGLPDLPDLPRPVAPPVSSALDDVTGGLGDLLDP